MRKNIFIIVLFLLISCQNNPNVVSKFPNDAKWDRANRSGQLFKDNDFVIFQKNTDYSFWDKTVEIISTMLPIDICDKKNYLISTEWNQIKDYNKDNSLYKINVYFKNNSITKKNMLISVFKKDKNGIVSNDILLENKIRNMIE